MEPLRDQDLAKLVAEDWKILDVTDQIEGERIGDFRVTVQKGFGDPVTYPVEHAAWLYARRVLGRPYQ